MSNTLQHSPADIVRAILVRAGLGSAPPTPPAAPQPWPIYASNEPSTPDEVVTVFDTTGSDDGRVMYGGELQEHMGFQVRVRATTHNSGYRKLNAIRVYVSEVSYQETIELDGTSYLVSCFAKIGDILPLGKDSPNTSRHLFTLNASIVVDQL